jgi:hypothetical protein
MHFRPGDGIRFHGVHHRRTDQAVQIRVTFTWTYSRISGHVPLTPLKLDVTGPIYAFEQLVRR